MGRTLRGAALAAVALVALAGPASVALAGPASVALAGPASAEPVDPSGPDVQPVAVAADAAPPVDDGKVVSSPPETTKSRDGWTLTVSAKDEIQRAVAPLTTAISTREYEVSGVFTATVKGAGGAVPKGVFEVGYQIGCGIDMSTGNGVQVTGNAGANAGVGVGIGDLTKGPIDLFIPQAGVSAGGGVSISLKPGLVNLVPLTKKNYVGSAPWVSISDYRIKIDGCVGQSYIRSYASLTKSTAEGDAVLSWYGVTKTV